MSHRIRLRGAWQATQLPDGRTRFTRSFGRPTINSEVETVWLTSLPIPLPARVFLNQQLLGDATTEGFSFDVTTLLNPRNEVAVELLGELSEVALEIHPIHG